MHGPQPVVVYAVTFRRRTPTRTSPNGDGHGTAPPQWRQTPAATRARSMSVTGRPPFWPFARAWFAFFADFARPPLRPMTAAAAARRRSSSVDTRPSMRCRFGCCQGGCILGYARGPVTRAGARRDRCRDHSGRGRSRAAVSLAAAGPGPPARWLTEGPVIRLGLFRAWLFRRDRHAPIYDLAIPAFTGQRLRDR